MTGKKGWHKRINNSMKQVSKEIELTDGPALSEDAASKIHAAAKAAVCKKQQASVYAPLWEKLGQPSSSSEPTSGLRH